MNEDGKEQLLSNHLDKVADLASKYANEFDSSEIAYQMGLIHDVGKYSQAFQRRIRGSSERVDHSTAGLQLSEKIFNLPVSKILGYCISGHHGGLPNIGNNVGEASTIMGRLSKSIEDYSEYSNEISLNKEVNISKFINILKNNIYPDFSISFYTRMLFSCLVDADFLNTESFMNDKISRKVEYNFETINEQLKTHLNKFKTSKGKINKKRREILNSCLENSQHEQVNHSCT